MKNKIELIYILGCGRSDSTLLDMILGSHKQIVSTCELQFFDFNKASANSNEFWKEIAFRFKEKLIKNKRDL